MRPLFQELAPGTSFGLGMSARFCRLRRQSMPKPTVAVGDQGIDDLAVFGEAHQLPVSPITATRWRASMSAPSTTVP